MSQKLSFNSIAATLAVLSASGLVGCGGAATPPAESPADAKEVPAATTAGVAAAAETAPTQGEVQPAEGASAATPAAATEAPKAAAEPAGAPAATPAGTPVKDPKTNTTAKKKHAGGAKGGCGAGTCG
jgi:hypothetical protein